VKVTNVCERFRPIYIFISPDVLAWGVRKTFTKFTTFTRPTGQSSAHPPIDSHRSGCFLAGERRGKGCRCSIRQARDGGKCASCGGPVKCAGSIRRRGFAAPIRTRVRTWVVKSERIAQRGPKTLAHLGAVPVTRHQVHPPCAGVGSHTRLADFRTRRDVGFEGWHERG
jgi:hypothetical protein